MNISKIIVNKNKLVNAVAYFTLIDIIVLPYYNVFIIPLSLPIILALFVLFVEKKKSQYFYLFMVFALFVFASVVFSIIFMSDQYMFDNIKRAGQLLMSFVYFFYFYAIRDKLDIRIV